MIPSTATDPAGSGMAGAPRSGARAANVEDATFDEAVGDDVFPAVPSEPFVYLVYPNHDGNWYVATVDGADVWLPILTKLPLAPGAANVRTKPDNGRAEDVWEHAAAMYKRQGAILLDPKEHRYLRAVKCADPKNPKKRGKIYFDAFETPLYPQPGKRHKMEQNRDARHRWLLGLLREGVIPPPPESVIARAVHAVVKRIDRTTAATPDNMTEATKTARLEKFGEVLETLEGASVVEPRARAYQIPTVASALATPTKTPPVRPEVEDLSDLGADDEAA